MQRLTAAGSLGQELSGRTNQRSRSIWRRHAPCLQRKRAPRFSSSGVYQSSLLSDKALNIQKRIYATQSIRATASTSSRSRFIDESTISSKPAKVTATPHTIIIDGTPIIDRSFYSIQRLTVNKDDPDSQPINAVYGYVRILLKITREWKFDNVIVCFDAGGRNFRKELFEDYKAQRKAAPDDLKSQFAIVREATEALNIPYIAQRGVEADDLIATYTDAALRLGHRITIMTPDKDMLQLVTSDKIVVVDPSPGKNERAMDRGAVKLRWGVEPEQIPDLQAIIGDKVDNIPKVRGISEKAAAVLINKFGTLENLMANLDQVEEQRYRAALSESVEMLQRSMQLVQLRRDIPDVPPIESFKYYKHDPTKFAAFCRKYSFLSLIKSEGDAEIFTGRIRGGVVGIESDLLQAPTHVKELEDRPRWMRPEGAVRAKFLEEHGGEDVVETEDSEQNAEEDADVPGLVASSRQLEIDSSRMHADAVEAAVAKARERASAIREAAAARVTPITHQAIRETSNSYSDHVVETVDDSAEFERQLATPDEEEDIVFNTEPADAADDNLIEYADADGHISMYDEGDSYLIEEDEYETMLQAVPGRDAVMNDDDALFEDAVFIPQAITQRRSDLPDFYEEDDYVDDIPAATNNGGDDGLIETISAESASADPLVEVVDEDSIVTANGRRRRKKSVKPQAISSQAQGDQEDDGLSVFATQTPLPHSEQVPSGDLEHHRIDNEFSLHGESEMVDDADEVTRSPFARPEDDRVAPMDDFADEFSGITPYTIKHKLPIQSIVDEEDPERRRNTLKGPGGSFDPEEEPEPEKLSLSKRLISFIAPQRSQAKPLPINRTNKGVDIFEEEDTPQKPIHSNLKQINLSSRFKNEPTSQVLPPTQPRLSREALRQIASASTTAISGAHLPKQRFEARQNLKQKAYEFEDVEVTDLDEEGGTQEFAVAGNRVIVGPRFVASASSSTASLIPTSLAQVDRVESKQKAAPASEMVEPVKKSALPSTRPASSESVRKAVPAKPLSQPVMEPESVDPEWVEFEAQTQQRPSSKASLPADRAAQVAQLALHPRPRAMAKPAPITDVEVEEVDDSSFERIRDFSREQSAPARPFLGGALTKTKKPNAVESPLIAPTVAPVRAAEPPTPTAIAVPTSLPRAAHIDKSRAHKVTISASTVDVADEAKTPELFDTPEIFESTDVEYPEEEQTTPADVQGQKIVEVDPEFIQQFEALKTDPKARRQLIETRLKGVVTVVNDSESARRVISKLMELKDRYHAIDTEAVELELKRQSPVGNGRVICASIYCGPDIDFGNGPRIWIDNQDDASGTLNLFREYFEDESLKKVFHNCSFDLHMLRNHNLDVKGYAADTIHMARLWNASRRTSGGYSLEALSGELLGDTAAKLGMKARFGRKRLKKDGTFAKVLVLPALDDLQRDPEWVCDWIDYSTLDADATWHLRNELEKELKKMPWFRRRETMWDFYQQIWGPFGQVLADMEWRGIKVDISYLQQLAPKALEDKQRLELKFLEWATSWCPDAKYMNPSSDAQKQQLFFAPCRNVKTGAEMPAQREFTRENTEGYVDPESKNGKPRKTRPFYITGLGLPFTDVTISGWPAVSQDVLQKLAGDPPNKWGDIVKLFEQKGLEGGKEACEAVAAVVESSRIETLLNNFMMPLQSLVDPKGRIHGSINLNTETGRLSSRRPNLQNQPAHEKDRYKIRKAFVAEPGNTLIVADYGQLELRLLAHITRCKSMIQAFREGGDFHSRTAMGMYPEVEEAVKNGDVLLEWDYSKGAPPKPLLKDKFGMQRRRAKTLNFSIAYGKTVMGLARDWGVSRKEAKDTLERWYRDRPEVKRWQWKTIKEAHETGYTRTLLGRYRPLPDINSKDIRMRAHSERAAINTPLQGGAADIVTKAMVNIHKDPILASLGYHMVLQVHDELILEGPEEHRDAALARTVDLMSNPLDDKLLVDLVVDAKTANSWYEAK